MLRRMLLALMTMSLLMSAASAIAEIPNLSQMNFEELAGLRARVNAEMLIRPEAEDIILPGGGEYVVGEDLLPGTYYFIYNDTSTGNIHVEVYKDKSATQCDSYVNCNSDDYLVHKLSVEEGNCIRTKWTIRLNKVGFPDYHAPEGTFIPAGSYEIGTDIPAGRYEVNLYAGRSRVVVFKDANAFENNGLKHYDIRLNGAVRTGNVTLADGNILVIESAGIVMSKFNSTFSFD